MSIRKIAALLRGNDADTAVLDYSLEVGQLFAAHIEAIHLAPGPAELDEFLGHFFANFSNDMVPGYHQVLRQHADSSLALFEDWAKVRGIASSQVAAVPPARVTAEWREENHSAEEAVSNWARFCDLVVAQRPGGRASGFSRYVLESLLVSSGRPLLLCPSEKGPIGRWASAVIAWNGSAQAVRAVTYALPLLRRMRHVHVLVIKDGKADGQDADKLSEYLSWHGIAAEVLVNASNGQIGASLLEQAANWDADLMVMGAYTRSPSRQQFFGGATTHMLDAATIPIFMVH